MIGDLNRVKTMKMEKIWRVLPVMYMPVRVLAPVLVVAS